MGEYSDIIRARAGIAPALAASNLDADPDQAAESYGLEQTTGVPGSAINADLDGFKNRMKAGLSGDMIRQSPQLDAYIKSHPLAPAISNDDYGNLSAAGRQMEKTSAFMRIMNAPRETAEALGAGFKEGFKEGYGPEPTGSWGYNPQSWDVTNAVRMAGVTPIEAGLRGLSAIGVAIPRAFAESTEAGVFGITGNRGLAMSAGNEAGAMAEFLTTDPVVMHSAARGALEAGELAQQNAKLAEAQTAQPYINEAKRQRAQAEWAGRAWTDAGLPVPAGVHPLIDKMYAQGNQLLLDELNKDLAAAQASLTKERSPEMFQNFVNRYHEGSEIGIDGRVVAELYLEGKEPTPGDGLLGWVPGIADKLAAARASDADVRVPVRDWIGRVDPALAKTLNDDIRMSPGLITVREATEAGEGAPRPPPIDAPIAQLRDYLGTEPMLSLGDRRVTLERVVDESRAEEYEERRLYAAEIGDVWKNPYHDFVIKDDTGKEIGSLNITQKDKQLYVDWVGGISGFGPRDIGPSAIRDMLKQLKSIFPDAEEVTGHRVSGARETAGTYHQPSAHPKVKLDEAGQRTELPTIKLTAEGEAPPGWGEVETTNEFHKILNEGYMQPMPHGYWYNDRLGLSWPEPVKPLMDIVARDLERITGGRLKGVDWMPVALITKDKFSDQPVAWGQFWGFTDRLPLLLVDMFSPDPIGTAHHEAIHFLRHAKLISPDEWRVLQNAALEGDWIHEHRIHERYAGKSMDVQVEEAVAEQFRAWYWAEAGKRADMAAKSPIARVFQKMADFWDGVKKSYREFTGKEPTPEDLFKDIHQGVMAERTPGHVVTDASGVPMKWDDAAPMPMDQATGAVHEDALQTQIDALKASGTGLDAKSYGIIQKLIRERYENDLQAAIKRSEKEQKTRQTDEWKSNYKGLRKEVEASIRQRPDVAADLFFGSGELLGHKVSEKYRIATADLTPEQQAALPRHYYGKEGLPLDGLAHMFGFPDGDSMVQALSVYNSAKAGLTPQEMLAKVIKTETDRQMEAKYGFLEKNILEDAKDQALSDTDVNILSQELYAAGLLNKTPTLTKDQAAAQAFDLFKKMELKEVSSDRFMAGVAKHARDIERNLLKGDNVSAIVGMQKKLISMMLAQHARRVEKELKSFEKVAKTYSAREVTGIEPEYLNYVHRVLMQIGKPVRRSIQDLAKEIEARASPGSEDFGAFVSAVNSRGREMPVWPQLLDDAWKKGFEDLTTEEFRAVRDSLKTMIFHGRNEMKLIKEGEAADLNDITGRMIQSLDKFAVLKYDVEGKRMDTRVPEWVRSRVAAHFKLETILNRWDDYDPFGDWNQYIMRPLFEGANQEDAWRKQYAHQLIEAGDGMDLNKTIANNLFRDPSRGEIPTNFDPLERMTRANLRAVMLNMGTESNLTKLGKGYNIEREAIEAWVHTYATAEDWAFVRKIWDIFKDIKGKSDTMYRSMTGGVPALDVPGRMIDTKFGQVEGGYYPLIAHPVFESRFHRTDPNALFDNHYTRASTPAGYMEQRTGAVYPLSLSLDSMPGRIAQMIHDVALRPAVVQASKVFYNPKMKAAIRTHYGKEYSDMLEPYLRDIANSRNYMPKDQQIMAKVSEFTRQNMITTLVGLNPGTVLKHGPTAWVQSMQEVGGKSFMREVGTMFSMDPMYGERNWEFAKSKSLELQRRDRHWQETLGGAVEELVPKPGLGSWRQRIMYWSSKPVAMSDMISAVPTWLAKYKDAIAEGRSEGDAVYLADRAVRRAHGSTSIVDRPGVMRGGSGWLTAVYNFFNHIMNRQAEMIWKSGEMMDLVKEGEWGAASKAMGPIAAQLFSYVLFPALIEELVTPLPEGKEHNWAKTAAKGLAFTLGASWVGVRDIVNALLRGSDPSVGLLSTAFKTGTDFARDFGKKSPLSKDHAGRLIRDGSVLFGLLTGLPGQQMGRVGQFAHGVSAGVDKPKGPWGWLVGLRYGTTKKHSQTFDDWMKGKSK